jgi:hypothetical protein
MSSDNSSAQLEDNKLYPKGTYTMNIQNILDKRREIENSENERKRKAEERIKLADEIMKEINDIIDVIDPIFCLGIGERTPFKISFKTNSEYDPVWMVEIKEDMKGQFTKRLLFRLESNDVEHWPTDKKEDWEKTFIDFIANKVPSHFLERAIEKINERKGK